MHLLVEEKVTEAQIEEKLRSVGIEHAEIHEIGPSLEDVFVTLTNNQTSASKHGTRAPIPSLSS
jgi:hypothetical protein